MNVRQLLLFDHPDEPLPGRGHLDDESECLLSLFSTRRAQEGSNTNSIRRDVSQLRSLVRECAPSTGPIRFKTLITDPAVVAPAFRMPAKPISRKTCSARLIAFQRSIKILSPILGLDAATQLRILDSLLPAKKTKLWHEHGILVAGTTDRSRRRGPTLSPDDLHRLVSAAGSSGRCRRDARERALIALQSYSGVRIMECLLLIWEDIGHGLTPMGYYGPTVRVCRQGLILHLPLPPPASEVLEELRAVIEQSGTIASGLIFRANLSTTRELSYGWARKVLKATCIRAGFPILESADLRAGCASWLRSQGLQDPEIAEVLGLAFVRSADTLLKPYGARDALRMVREHSEIL